MGAPARARQNRAAITTPAGPGSREGAPPARPARSDDQPTGPTGPTGAEAIYRTLFDSFDRGKDGKISHWEVLSRLQRSGLQSDDPRIQHALTGLRAADASSKQISFQQFKNLVRHNSSLIQRAVEGNLAVPEFSALTSDIDRIYAELLLCRTRFLNWPKLICLELASAARSPVSAC